MTNENETPTEAIGEVAYTAFIDGKPDSKTWEQIGRSTRVRWIAALFAAIESLKLTREVVRLSKLSQQLSWNNEVLRECSQVLASDLAEIENDKQMLTLGRVKRKHTTESILTPLRKGIIIRLKREVKEEERKIRERLEAAEAKANPAVCSTDASRVGATETASDSDTGRLPELAPKNPSCRSAESRLVFPPLSAVDTAPTQPPMETASDDYQTRSHFDDIANGRD